MSNQGNVRSLFRYRRKLKWNITKNGYATVELFGDGKKQRLLVHRLVAKAFVENPLNKPQVNHKDENKLNNFASNLEWVTPKENMNYGTRLQRQLIHIDYSAQKRKEIAIKNGKCTSRPVLQLDLNGNIIKRYESGKDAFRQTGISHSHILECCAGKRYKTVGGFIWRYDERNDDLLASQF